MQFEPKTKQELDAAGLLSEGNYDFEVLEAQERTSSKGNPMIEVKLGVWTNNRGQKYITDYLMEKLAYKLYHFCESVGIDYHAGELKAEELPGKCGVVRVKIDPERTGDDGKVYSAKNAVKDYVAAMSAETPPAPSQPAQSNVLHTGVRRLEPQPVDDETIPF